MKILKNLNLNDKKLFPYRSVKYYKKENAHTAFFCGPKSK